MIKLFLILNKGTHFFLVNFQVNFLMILTLGHFFLHGSVCSWTGSSLESPEKQKFKKKT